MWLMINFVWFLITFSFTHFWVYHNVIILEDYNHMKKAQLIKIKFLLRSIGMPPHILGYTYTAEAINFMITTPDKSLFINDIYHHVALCYSTSPNCVEVSIRNAVKKTYTTNNAYFNKIFKNSSKICNHIFLTVLRDVFEESYLQYL